MAGTHLVTGVSGFLGQKTANLLLSKGYPVIGVDVFRDEKLDPNVDFRRVDVRDYEAIRDSMRGVEVVHHHAALVPLTRAYGDFWSVNVEGSRTVARAAKAEDVQHFLHTSSSAVFGKTGNAAITEATRKKPLEPYGRSKLAGEDAVKDELLGSPTKLAIIRPRTILGANRGGIFSIFFRWISEGRPIFTIGDGENLFQFVHVEDLLGAYESILRANAIGEYNVGTQDFSSLNDAFRNLIKAANSDTRVLRLPTSPTVSALFLAEKFGLSPLAPWHYRTFHRPFFFDLTSITSTGWVSKYSNDQLLYEAYDSYKNGIYSQVGPGSPHSSNLESKFLEAGHRLVSKIWTRV